MINKIIIESVSFERVGNSVRAIINTYIDARYEEHRSVPFSFENEGKIKKARLVDTWNHIIKYEFRSTGFSLDEALNNAIADLKAGDYSGFDARLDWPDFDQYDVPSYTWGLVTFSSKYLRDMIDSKLEGIDLSQIKLKIK